MSSNIKKIQKEISELFPDKLEIPRIATKKEIMNAELDNEHIEFPEPTDSFRYREYMDIRDKFLEKYENKINPKTKKIYDEVTIVQIANDAYRKLLNKKRVDSMKEAVKHFSEYYTSKYGKSAIKRMIKDMERKRKETLKVGSLYSSKFYGKNGPEDYDIDGLDSGLKNITGESMKLYKSLKKKSRKTRKSKKNKKTRKSKK